MKKTSADTIAAIQACAKKQPEQSLKQIAAKFGISEPSVKRFCANSPRGKNWRRGRKQAFPDVDRFWLLVDRVEAGCWPWKGSLTNAGYGSL